jgi:hypothetical protein
VRGGGAEAILARRVFKAIKCTAAHSMGCALLHTWPDTAHRQRESGKGVGVCDVHAWHGETDRQADDVTKAQRKRETERRPLSEQRESAHAESI